MFSTSRSMLADQREASKRVAQASRFSIRLPLVGRVRVPPPDQLAFVGALGALVALELIEWPVALAMGLGSVVISHRLSELAEPSERNDGEQPAAPAKKTPPAKKAPAKKTPAKKAPAKKTARKAPPRP